VQLQDHISAAADTKIQDYQQNSQQFVDDVRSGIDTLEKAQDVKEAIEAYKNNDTDNYVAKTMAASVLEAARGAAIDAAIPKNGDPVHDALNDFTHTLDRLSQTEPTLSGAIERVKIVFKDLTGNAEHNLKCLHTMITDLNSDSCPSE
jgi:hypothetical protein